MARHVKPGATVVNKRYPFIKRVLEYWTARSVRYLPGVTKAEILAFEQSKDVRLPDELRAFYRVTNGLRVPGSPEVDDRQYDFWPLQQVRPDEERTSMLYFADFAQSSWQFSVEAVGNAEFEKGAVFVVPGRFIKVASTFGQFMELYMADDTAIYPVGWGRA